MNPICVSCGTEMKCIANSVTVAHEENPHWVRTGDVFSCGECHTQIIVGMGEAFDSPRPADKLINNHS